MTTRITGLGQRDGSELKVEVIQDFEGDTKDYILRKTGQHKVTLFRVLERVKPEAS